MLHSYFNPRSRVGNDELPDLRKIHLYRYFNPRSRMGNDNFHLVRRNAKSDFNPRSRVGNDYFLEQFRL